MKHLATAATAAAALALALAGAGSAMAQPQGNQNWQGPHGGGHEQRQAAQQGGGQQGARGGGYQGGPHENNAGAGADFHGGPGYHGAYAGPQVGVQHYVAPQGGQPAYQGGRYHQEYGGQYRGAYVGRQGFTGPGPGVQSGGQHGYGQYDGHAYGGHAYGGDRAYRGVNPGALQFNQHAMRGRDQGRGWYDPDRWRRGGEAEEHFHVGVWERPHGWYYHRWYYGDYLPWGWFAPTFYLDWGDYDLPPPPVGCEWVREGDDAVLVDIWTGQVLSVEYGVFY